MKQKTEQISVAIQEFLQSIDAAHLRAVKIDFEDKPAEISPLDNCGWEWDPIKKDLVWKCYP